MNLDQKIYGSADWHLPSPSSTPKSVTFPDTSFKTPKTDVSQSHFLDAWSTPRVNGHQTPVQTPSFTLSTPIDRSSSTNNQSLRTPDDPQFHVHHFASNNLPLPPVEPARRLSSSPDPLSARPQGTLRDNPSLQPRPVSMDMSQMQTPPPTRDASSRRSMHQQGRNEFATPATVVAGTPSHGQSTDGSFNPTPFGIPNLQFSPDMIQFSNNGPYSAPALPHSRLFWDQQNDGNNMDLDMAITSDPFGPTPHRIGGDMGWQTFHTPPSQMNSQAFQALHGMSSPAAGAPFVPSNAGPNDGMQSRPSSFISTTSGIDPSMLFGYSSPGPTAPFNNATQHTMDQSGRQPYETQLRDSLVERDLAMKAKSQHSRTNTSSSNASFENTRPPLQRSNTDSGLRKSRPASMDSKASNSAAGFNIPRRSSPLKRQSGGSLTSIPEMRRPRTRLVIDDSGRARTETVPVEEDVVSRAHGHREPQKDFRSQYPGLWAEEDSESEPEEPVTLSRNASFNIPPRRSSKHGRTDSGGCERSNSFKVSRPSSGVFDRSFETVRPVKKSADNALRRFSMMDFPTSFEHKENEDQPMPDSPGDALGALKKVVEGRQKRIERSSQNTLKAHNQRWAQVSADLNPSTSPHGGYDPFSNSFSASPATNTDPDFATPSTDRSSLSNESTRCVCNTADDGRPMVQCESCNKWLHISCIGLNPQKLPPVYVCVFCTGQTPVARGGRVRGPLPTFDSPLTHKSVFRR